MPRIRTYEQQVFGGSQELKASTDPLLGAPEKALMNVGKSLQGLGETVYKYNVSQDMNKANYELARLRNEYTDKIQKETQAGTIDSQKLFEEYQSSINEVTGFAETREGRDYLELRSAQLGSELTRSASISQAQVAGQMAVERWNESLNLNGNTLQKSPSGFENIYRESIESLDAQVLSGTIDKTDAEKLKRLTGEQLAESTVRGWIDINRHQARKLLDQGAYDKYLRPNDKAQLINHIDALDRAENEKKKSIENLRFKDPWEYLEKVGVTPPPVDLTNQKSIVDRIMFIEKNAKAFGYFQDEIPFLTTSEARDIVRVLDQQDPSGANALLRNMSQNIPPSSYALVAKQIFKDSPAHGVAMSIAAEDGETSEKILAGKALIRDNTKGGVDSRGMVTSSAKEVATVFDSYIGNSISDPDLRIRIKDAAHAHYLKTRFDAGDDLQILDDDDFTSSLEKVIGPVAQVNDSKVVSFRRKDGNFVSAGELESRFENLDSGVIQRSQGDVPRLLNGEALNLEKSSGRINAVSVGNGKYMLKRDEELLFDKSGQPFVLDMKKYMDTYDSEEKPGFWNRVFGGKK